MATSDSPLSVPDVTLAVARSASAAAPSGELAYSAPNGLADGETITVTTDGSGGWDFGPAPKDLGTLGFGKGFLYDQPLGTNLTDFVDPISGTQWLLDRDDDTRIVGETEGLRASLTDGSSSASTTTGGGWLTWASSEPLEANEILYITTLAKADWGFINTSDPSPIASVQEIVSGTQITLSAPWSGSTDSRVRVIIAPDPADSTVIRESKMYLSLTNGSDQATLNIDSDSDFVESGVQQGDSIMLWAAVQWKGLRPSGTLFEFNDPNMYWKNNNGFFGWPLEGVITGGISGSQYNLAGQPVTKIWCRTDSFLNMGPIGGSGSIKERAIRPGSTGFADFAEKSFPFHSSAYRWRYFQFQEYIQYLTNPKMWRTDTAIQVGTKARVELANAATPGAVTEVPSYLPPVLAQWSANSVQVYLWKGLMFDYTGKYLHVYDQNDVFVGGVAL